MTRKISNLFVGVFLWELSLSLLNFVAVSLRPFSSRHDASEFT